MPEPDMTRRAEIARRLKAARWLAGDVDTAGKAKVTALSPEQLAQREPLPENQITASLIGSIERMERHTPPMELDALATALGVAPGYFTAELPAGPALSPEQIQAAAELLAPQLLAAAREISRAPGSAPPAQALPDRPGADRAGADG